MHKRRIIVRLCISVCQYSDSVFPPGEGERGEGEEIGRDDARAGRRLQEIGGDGADQKAADRDRCRRDHDRTEAPADAHGRESRKDDQA